MTRQILTHAQLRKWRLEHMPDRCPILECPLTRPELDHDHLYDKGMVRQVVQGEANALIGKIENQWRTMLNGKTHLSLADVLRNVAAYLEEDYSSHPLHPAHRAVVRREFNRKKKKEQLALLGELGVDCSQLANSKQRANAFAEAVLTKYEDHRLSSD